MCTPMPGTARNREPQPPSCDPEAPCAGSIICPPLELLGGTPPILQTWKGVLVAWGCSAGSLLPLPWPRPLPASSEPSAFLVLARPHRSGLGPLNIGPCRRVAPPACQPPHYGPPCQPLRACPVTSLLPLCPLPSWEVPPSRCRTGGGGCCQETQRGRGRACH